MGITVELPFPPRALHPNSRVHWAARAKATKQAREDAAWWARAAGVKPMRKAKPLVVFLTFFPPDKRRRDWDGAVSSCKAYFDGIADALGVDDSNFRPGVIRWGEPRDGGVVRIEIAEAQI